MSCAYRTRMLYRVCWNLANPVICMSAPMKQRVSSSARPLVHRILSTVFLAIVVLPAAIGIAGRYEIEVPAPPQLGGTTWRVGEVLRLEYRVENALIRMNTIAQGCVGHVTGDPAFRIRIASDSSPILRLESSGDTVLAIIGPEGEVFCNDDHYGLNSQLNEALRAGVWDVYIGTYGPGSTLDTVLVIE